MSKTAVYYHTDANGSLLYVGCAACPAQRFMGHRSIRSWATDVANIRIKWFATREEALAFESAEIMRLKPKHNTEWQPAKGSKWQVNEGMLYMLNWRDNHGGSAKLLAQRLVTTEAQVQKYFDRVAHPGTKRATHIALATDGFVPRHAFNRGPHSWYRDAPIIRFPTSEQAAAEVAEIKGSARYSSEQAA